MPQSGSERDRANRRLIQELRQQRAEIQRSIEAAQKTVAATQDAITRSQRLLAQIDQRIEKADEADRSEAAVVDGMVGGSLSGVSSLLGVEQQPRFLEYVARQDVPSYRYEHEVRVGAVLSSSGVRHYDVPAEFGVDGYHYTVVNGRSVLVEPRTHRIVQVIE